MITFSVRSNRTIRRRQVTVLCAGVRGTVGKSISAIGCISSIMLLGVLSKRARVCISLRTSCCPALVGYIIRVHVHVLLSIRGICESFLTVREGAGKRLFLCVDSVVYLQVFGSCECFACAVLMFADKGFFTCMNSYMVDKLVLSFKSSLA